MMETLRVWEILDKFKDACSLHDWRTCKTEDWVETDGEYHNFLWTRDVHPSSFTSIASNMKCITHEGSSYRVVEASYEAWLFSEAPHDGIIKTVSENPKYSGKIALYDLSPVLRGEKACTRLNNTDSPVFKEFEHFLKDELKIKLKPFSLLSEEEIKGSCTITEPA
jgi:hypothetical protein